MSDEIERIEELIEKVVSDNQWANAVMFPELEYFCLEDLRDVAEAARRRVFREVREHWNNTTTRDFELYLERGCNGP